VLVDLPAGWVGLRQAPAYSSWPDGAVLPGTRPMLADGRTKAAAEREGFPALARALKHLPSGACLVIRDDSGREWHISPADQVIANRLRKAA
jgi:hypothetical protein